MVLIEFYHYFLLLCTNIDCHLQGIFKKIVFIFFGGQHSILGEKYPLFFDKRLQNVTGRF